MDINEAVEYLDRFCEFDGSANTMRAWLTLKSAVLSKQTNNKPNTQLCDCEQLYIGCAITGGNCKTRGLTKCA